jgi:ABC-type enterochelin transport system ATPase subunit
MEYNFISKTTLDNIINNYISSLPACKQEKALINMELLERIKKILLDPNNKEIDVKSTREWAKKRFDLEEITPGDYRVQLYLKIIINLF